MRLHLQAFKFVLTAVASVVLIVPCAMRAQAPDVEDAAMAVDSAAKSCVELQDSNHWTTYTNDMSGVGSAPITLATLLNNLNQTAPAQTSGDHAPAIGYAGGVYFASGDQATTAWSPQGLAQTTSGSKEATIVSWHWINSTDPNSESPNGARISVFDTTSTTASKYRDIILVEPSGTGTYKPVLTHAGGIAVMGNYLYLTITTQGFMVFDLNNFRTIDGDSTLCANTFAKVSGHWCADGYPYMLPASNTYYLPSSVTGTCRPKFSWAGNDLRPATNLLLSGEYCNENTDQCERQDGTAVDPTGLNGRLYQWPVGSDGKMVTTSGIAKATNVFWLNQRNVNGVAPDLVHNADGSYQVNTYWLGSRRHDSSIIKVSASAPAVWWSVDDSQAPYSPEGMHATDGGQHLWVLGEGQDDASGNPILDPATGGRAITLMNQALIN